MKYINVTFNNLEKNMNEFELTDENKETHTIFRLYI